MLINNTQAGQKMVIRGIYNIQYSQFFSVMKKDKTPFPALAQREPPSAKVVKIRRNWPQLTPHLFLN